MEKDFNDSFLTNIEKATLMFQWKAANEVPNSDVSKNLMSHFFATGDALKRDLSVAHISVCQKCCSIFYKSKCVSRIQPKIKVTNKNHKALKRLKKNREKAGDVKSCKSVLNSPSILKIKCCSCGFTNKLVGATRSKLSSLKSNQSNPKRKSSGGFVRSLANRTVDSPLSLSFNNRKQGSSKKKRKSLSTLSSLFTNQAPSSGTNLSAFLSSL